MHDAVDDYAKQGRLRNTAFTPEQLSASIKDIKAMEKSEAWIIGSVESGPRTTKIVENPTIIEVWSSL